MFPRSREKRPLPALEFQPAPLIPSHASAFPSRTAGPHRGSGGVASRQLHPQALINPMGGVPLLARGLAVRLRDGVDELPHCPQLGTGPFRSLPLRRQRASRGFPDHPAMHPELPCYAANRSLAVLVLSPDLLE